MYDLNLNVLFCFKILLNIFFHFDIDGLCRNAELCVDMQCDTLIRVDKLAEPIGRQVNALHCGSIRYFGLAICNSCRLYYVRFQRVLNANLTSTKTRAVVNMYSVTLYFEEQCSSVLDVRLRGHWFKTHRRHCIFSLSKLLCL